MTELLIVSKPRGRIHKWIYGQYKEYLESISFDKGSFTNPLTVNATGTAFTIYSSGSGNQPKKRAQRFRTPNNLQTDSNKITLEKVKLSLKRGALTSGTVIIVLKKPVWSVWAI